LEKVLPRVQGEQKQLETQNGKSNVLKDLKTFVESHFKPEEDTDANSLYNQVLRKLKEMDDKLANYYTNFF
jgi:hemerythrin